MAYAYYSLLFFTILFFLCCKADELLTTDPSYDEKELLNRTMKGDQYAFECLAMQYAEKLFAHALSFLKSYPLAQEAVQDIFLKIWLNRGKLDSINNFDDYLFIISKNYLISALRRKIIVTEYLGEGSAWEEQFYRPDDQYSAKELKQLLEAGIRQLPEQKQQIFRMIHLEGFSQIQVAAALGISERTVRYHLAASINTLKDFLHQHLQGNVPVFLFFLSFSHLF